MKGEMSNILPSTKQTFDCLCGFCGESEPPHQQFECVCVGLCVCCCSTLSYFCIQHYWQYMIFRRFNKYWILILNPSLGCCQTTKPSRGGIIKETKWPDTGCFQSLCLIRHGVGCLTDISLTPPSQCSAASLTVTSYFLSCLDHHL